MDPDDFKNTFFDPLVEKLISENKEIFLVKNEVNSTSMFIELFFGHFRRSKQY